MEKKIKKRWVLVDTYFAADDNCEHFYKWLRKEHPEIHLTYLLDRSSKDYNRLKKEGFHLVQKHTNEFYEECINAQTLISSQLWKQICEEYKPKESQKIIFIPHGITLGDSSRYFNKGDFDLCTSCIENEYNSYISGEYNYKANKNVFKLTGMPRHDTLIKKLNTHNKCDERIISFVFTYRANNENPKEYYYTLNKLFNCKYLKEIHTKYGIKFRVKFHPWITKKGYESKFSLPSYIENCRNMSYQEFLLDTDILISDYSSACQEFAVIGRNILYYQFDRNTFLSKTSTHSYDLGWFDWDKDSLGKICLTEEELCKSIDKIISNNFEVEQLYKDRMKNFFKFSDTENCKRVFETIVENQDIPRWENNSNYKPIGVKSKYDRIIQLRKDIADGKIVKVHVSDGKFVWKRIK